MYVWDSEMLRCFRSGTIVILANSLEEAREKAIVDGEKYIRQSWWGNCEETVQEKMNLLRGDISITPEETNNLFLMGSE